MRETHARSVVKTVIWRFIASLTTVVLVFIFTGDLTITVGIGIIDIIAKMIFYYLHERAWNMVKWGIR